MATSINFIVFVFIALLILLSSGCSTLKSKQKLVQKGFESIDQKGYGMSGRAFISSSQSFNADLRQSVLKSISKREIRIRLKNMEQFWALFPDSSVQNGNEIDSFYTNKSKMAYIQANNLQTKNTHFIR